MIEFLRDLLVRDFWLKLFSLALAVLIWLTVSIAIRKEVSPGLALNANNLEERDYFNIPVAVMASAADVRGFKVDPSEIEVVVRADAKRLQELHASDIEAWVDLRGIESAARGVRLPIKVTRPPGVADIRIVPPEADVVIPPKR